MSQTLGLYVHWPFCVSKCPYCDFNSHVRDKVEHKRWKEALLKELRWMGAQTPGRKLTSVFFGGGTPSLMDPETVHAIVEELPKHWEVKNPEITLEANPNSVETQKLRDFRAAGVNRVSLGIQSLKEEALKFLGRAHSVKEATRAIETAAETFERYSFDLIYARPSQTLKEWELELKEAMTFIRDHISLYQLTIEQGTAFHTAYARKDFILPDSELAAQMFEKTNEILVDKGIHRYEVSNHARKGKECQHNLVYWRYQDYAGIGPGAHGRLTINGIKTATQCYRAPETWLQEVETKAHGIQEKVELAIRDQVIEALMMGLRLTEGINLHHFKEVFKKDLLKIISNTRVQALIREGYVFLDGNVMRLTSEGLLRLNRILTYLTEDLDI